MLLKELENTNQKFVEQMKKERGVLGAWYFGSLSHDNADKYSDIDIVFLLDNENFERIDKERQNIMKKTGAEIVVEWAEEFNDDAIKNYCYILNVSGKNFQYDVFMLNQNRLDEFMCQIHYADMKESDIIFEKGKNVSALLGHNGCKDTWKADVHRLIQTYWFHMHMTAKYLARKDYFKLEGVLRTLMDTHSSLLLTQYDRITWGGTANKLHFIPEEKQKHLMKYGCIDDFDQIKQNLLEAMDWFIEDSKGLQDKNEIDYCVKTGEKIKKHYCM